MSAETNGAREINARHGIALDRQTLRFERIFPGPIERVWACLTESELRRKWLAGGEMELTLGGRVELFFLHSELTPHDEVIPERFCSMEQGHRMQGYITACEPPQLLAYTWGEADSASEVSFELAEQGSSVLLTLTHRRVQDVDNMVGFGGGWHTHLAILDDYLNGRVPRPFWTEHARYDAEYSEGLKALRRE